MLMSLRISGRDLYEGTVAVKAIKLERAPRTRCRRSNILSCLLMVVDNLNDALDSKDAAERRLVGLFQMRIMLKVCLCHGQTCWQRGAWD